MLIASDFNDNRIHIDDTVSNQTYYCPYCGAPLITKKGNVRQHHFAHKADHICSDSWERTRTYDVSDWHDTWQNQFPKENQEIKVAIGEIKHRADVMVGNTVIEFQHSIMSAQAFDDRNNFYFNLGYKVVWLFDLSDIFLQGQLDYEKNNDGLTFRWTNPKKAFNSYDVLCGCIDLFFEIKTDESRRIVLVKNVSETGFDSFDTTDFMSCDEFLAYVGCNNGVYPLPRREDIALNENYLRFKTKYNISLNFQQERALQAIEGHNLLLAVPGSGKTTVLVDRIGYMILERGIEPQNILALTYNKQAAAEMKERFCQIFGTRIGNAVHFQTLNSLANQIYLNYCIITNRATRELIDEKQKRGYLLSAYKDIHPNDYPDEGTYIELETSFSYIKNMTLSEAQIKETFIDGEKWAALFASYQKHLADNKKYDFDDQAVFANYILNHDNTILSFYQKQYPYVCVDEAQDTSKIQFDIIHKLAEHNNLFMVGDEDQSIYGFRAAYPKALLNFRYDYKNPYILRMERNYRSTPEIVDAAQRFISANKGRYEKNMGATRPSGTPISIIDVATRRKQYLHVLETAKHASTETAFLFRDNDSSVVLVDLFLRSKISFRFKKPEMNFFNHKVVKDVVAYLKLSLNPYDTGSFSAIRNKGILYAKQTQADWTIRISKNKHVSVYDAFEEQMQYVEKKFQKRAADFRTIMKKIEEASTYQAIDAIRSFGYENYMQENHYDFGKLEILMQLAEQEPDKQAFLKRLVTLEKLYTNGFSNDENSVILSTIHSAKGMEFDTVYMVDVYDGRFPSSEKNRTYFSKDNADTYQEERRLFYVSITRAKNNLYLYSIADRTSSYLDELFPTRVAAKREAERERNRQRKMKEEAEQEERKLRQQAQRAMTSFLKKNDADESDFTTCQNEIMSRIDQQNEVVHDHTGRRWVKCEKCGTVRPTLEFISYGGVNHLNLGVCYGCANKKT